jgi:unsaturated rhamnogalacturonyl hydrolase
VADLTGAPAARVEQRVLGALLAMQRKSWEQGVAGQAFLDLGLGDLAEVVAYDAVLHATPEGRLAEVEGHPSAVNTGALGEVVHAVAARRGDRGLGEAFERLVRWIAEDAPRADDGTLFHLIGSRTVWADTVYMTVPLLVLAGRVDEAERQLAGHALRLRDPGTGLYAHIWDEDAGALSRAVPWASGNGWVAAALARALRLMVVHGIEAREFADRAATAARELVDACLAHRRPDGMFHDVLDDPTTFPEVTAGQMLAYTTLTGVADGWLPADYAQVGRDLLAVARAHVNPSGVVEDACSAPDFDRPGRSAEAQAFHLLATAAARRVAEA